MVPPFFENILVIFSQFKYIFVLSDPVIHFLGLFPKEIVSELQKANYDSLVCGGRVHLEVPC